MTAMSLHQVSKALRDNRLSGRDKVLMERQCRICSSSQDMTRHHLVPVSWFFSDEGAHLRMIRNANANIVPLCVNCHQIIDGIRQPVLRLQFRAALRARLGTNEIAFILQVQGREWLEEHYPRDP